MSFDQEISPEGKTFGMAGNCVCYILDSFAVSLLKKSTVMLKKLTKFRGDDQKTIIQLKDEIFM